MATIDIDQLIAVLQSLKTTNDVKKSDTIIEKIDNCESKADLNKFKIEDLKKYCKTNEINVDGMKTKYVNAIWKHIEAQYEWYYSDETDEDEYETNDDSDSDYECDD